MHYDGNKSLWNSASKEWLLVTGPKVAEVVTDMKDGQIRASSST